jgi:hypothetical protein
MSKEHTEGWIAVDFDGTLAYYDYWRGGHHAGAPIPAMRNRVNQWIADGKDVRILTARVCSLHSEHDRELARLTLNSWMMEHLDKVLPITSEKDHHMIQLWDDRAIQVETNEGWRVDGLP